MTFDVPLPSPNTGLGFHYFPDEAHYRAKDLQVWLPELAMLGASWVTLIGSLDRAIPELFVRGLIDSGIEPIIHLRSTPIQRIDPDTLEVLYRSYARWGVHYVVVYDQPNTCAAWGADEWGNPDLINHFVDLLEPVLQLAQANGLTPVFPPLKQGGDYWDTSFLDKALRLMKGRNRETLLHSMVFGIYGFTGDRPIDWGVGGPTRWPEAKPYNTQPGLQDGSGFRAFEWYADVVRRRLGDDHPMLMLAGGARLADSEDPDWHTSCNIGIARAMLDRALPPYLLNVNFWLLAGNEEGWQQADGAALPAREVLRQDVANRAATRKAAAPAETKSNFSPKHVPTSLKPIYHYLLMPSAEWGDWIAAMDYVRKFQPTCGFSIEEAVYAAHVTILGNESAISAEVEYALRAAGCEVERLCAADSVDTQDQLNARARAGTRFAFI
jgi:hypothetical protein